MPQTPFQPKSKIAIFHHFFKSDCKGGGENLVLSLREKLGADLWVGGLDLDGWSRADAKTDKSFAGRVWDERFGFEYLHLESKAPAWKLLKRQLFFWFSPKVKLLNQYQTVIFSYGNIAFVPGRLGSQVKKIMYCHTPPRAFTDQSQKVLKKLHPVLRPVFKIFQKLVLWQWKRGFEKMDITIANSENIKNRIFQYTGLTVDEVIFPPVNVDRFKYLGQGDYFLSYGRLEDLKRTKLIVKAFEQMPDKKLVICSGGPLTDWVKNYIQERNLTNISFEGKVSDERLAKLVGNCLAGVYIPEDEDAGITQCEIMSAGKPVIGVKEGGLLETVIDGQTGILLPADPKQEDLVKVVLEFDPVWAKKQKIKCRQQALKFSQDKFFQKIQKLLDKNRIS